MKCSNLNHIDYKYFQGSNGPWFCISCGHEIFHLGTLTNKNLSMMINSSPTTVKNSDANINTSSSLALKHSANLSFLVNQFNNFSPEQKNEPENVVNIIMTLTNFKL